MTSTGTQHFLEGDKRMFEGTIMRRNKPIGNDKHPWKAEVTEGDAGVSESTVTNWFKAVYEPAYAGD